VAKNVINRDGFALVFPFLTNRSFALRPKKTEHMLAPEGASMAKREPQHEQDELDLERYGQYLRLLADLRVRGGRLRVLLDLSGLVQETLFKAYKMRARFQGWNEDQIRAYLARMLGNRISDGIDALGCAIRDYRKERRLADEMERSSSRFVQWAVDSSPSPSHVAQQHELLERLTNALMRLPESQRLAVMWRHLNGMSVAEIAAELGVTEDAVGGLIYRGCRKLRGLLGTESEAIHG
jgi:RNA polymerase sigma-70 factor (subfamily 1)